MSLPFAVLCGFGLAVGRPAHFLGIRRAAAAGLRGLPAKRPSPSRYANEKLRTSDGTVTLRRTYDDEPGSGRGRLDRSAGTPEPQPAPIATDGGSGGLVVWKGLQPGDSAPADPEAIR